MSSATDELRRMLDERGVEWWPAKYYKDENTVWRANGMEWRASEQTDGKLLIGCTSLAHLTPGQVIVATLGPGTCHNEAAPYCRDYWFCCSECEFVAHVNKTAINYCPNCGRRVVEAGE